MTHLAANIVCVVFGDLLPTLPKSNNLFWSISRYFRLLIENRYPKAIESLFENIQRGLRKS